MVPPKEHSDERNSLRGIAEDVLLETGGGAYQPVALSYKANIKQAKSMIPFGLSCSIFSPGRIKANLVPVPSQKGNKQKIIRFAWRDCQRTYVTKLKDRPSRQLDDWTFRKYAARNTQHPSRRVSGQVVFFVLTCA
jgi:hypothetical protein